MNKKEYTFRFKGGAIKVWAFNKEQAEILAKAEAINKGWNYEILNHDIEHYYMVIDWTFLTQDEEILLRDLLEKACMVLTKKVN